MRRRAPLLSSLALLLAVGIPATTTLARFTDGATSTGSFAADTLAPPTGSGRDRRGHRDADLDAQRRHVRDRLQPLSIRHERQRLHARLERHARARPRRPPTARATAPGTTSADHVRQLDERRQQPGLRVVTGDVDDLRGLCHDQAADTSGAGDNNGYQTNPRTRAAQRQRVRHRHEHGDGHARVVRHRRGAGHDQGSASVLGLRVRSARDGRRLNGIRVQADLQLNTHDGTNTLCAQLSWDGGTTWTTIKTQAITVAAETTLRVRCDGRHLGPDLDARPAQHDQLPRPAHRRVDDANRDFSLDYLAVSVTYAP